MADKRSEERRVGKECSNRWWPYTEKNKQNNNTQIDQDTST